MDLVIQTASDLILQSQFHGLLVSSRDTRRWFLLKDSGWMDS